MEQDVWFVCYNVRLTLLALHDQALLPLPVVEVAPPEFFGAIIQQPRGHSLQHCPRVLHGPIRKLQPGEESDERVRSSVRNGQRLQHHGSLRPEQNSEHLDGQ